MDKEVLAAELQFKAVRSSGAGGQNVNKIASKVELIFDVEASSGLDDEEKHRLKKKLANRLTNDNILLLQCEESRSQHKNKTIVIKRFFDLLEAGLFVPKKRIPTKTPRSVVKKRMKAKRKLSDKKSNRKPPEIE